MNSFIFTSDYKYLKGTFRVHRVKLFSRNLSSNVSEYTNHCKLSPFHRIDLTGIIDYV